MGNIKSALEIAVEKVAKLEQATDEERLKWKYIPEGEKLAARYLKEDCNLVVELGKYEEKVKKYIMEGAGNILIRNINLPKNDLAKRNNRRSMVDELIRQSWASISVVMVMSLCLLRIVTSSGRNGCKRLEHKRSVAS